MSLPRIMKVEEQRARYINRVMLSIGLEAQLMLLADKALAGDMHAVTEFQQFIQYAPVEMKARMQEYISK